MQRKNNFQNGKIEFKGPKYKRFVLCEGLGQWLFRGYQKMRLVMADNIGEGHGTQKLIFRGVRHKKPFCHHGTSDAAPCHGYQKMHLVFTDNID